MGDGENRGKPLFVHECRRIAAPAECRTRRLRYQTGRQGRPAHLVIRGIFPQARIYSRYVAPQIDAGRLANAQ